MMPRQEVTLDFATFSNLAKMAATDLRNHKIYADLFSNLKQYHVLCLDKKNDNTSEWFNKYVSLLAELTNLSSFAPHIKKIIDDDFSKFFRSNEPLRFPSDKLDISSICTDIASKSDFKIIVKEPKDLATDLIQLSIDEFQYGELPKFKCVLLRKEKTIDFKKGDNAYFLKFLHPYLYYSNSLVIHDKFFLKVTDHSKIIQTLLSYMREPKSIIIHTQYSNSSDINAQEIKKNINQFYGRDLLKLIDCKNAHPRNIITDYSHIELTNTLNCLEQSGNNLIATSDISFNMRIK